MGQSGKGQNNRQMDKLCRIKEFCIQELAVMMEKSSQNARV
jgi:hypothetical protein